MFVYIGVIEDILNTLQASLSTDHRIQEQREKYKGKRLQSFLAGRCLLKYALCQHGFLQEKDDIPEMVFNDLGKPFFKNHICSFSISHSKNIVAVGVGTEELGVDVEVMRRPQAYSANIVKYSLNALEQQKYEDLAKKECESAAEFFIQQWTVRECLVKAAGRSIFESKKLDINPYTYTISTSMTPNGAVSLFRVEQLVQETQGQAIFLTCFSENRVIEGKVFIANKCYEFSHDHRAFLKYTIDKY